MIVGTVSLPQGVSSPIFPVISIIIVEKMYKNKVDVSWGLKKPLQGVFVILQYYFFYVFE